MISNVSRDARRTRLAQLAQPAQQPLSVSLGVPYNSYSHRIPQLNAPRPSARRSTPPSSAAPSHVGRSGPAAASARPRPCPSVNTTPFPAPMAPLCAVASRRPPCIPPPSPSPLPRGTRSRRAPPSALPSTGARRVRAHRGVAWSRRTGEQRCQLPQGWRPAEPSPSMTSLLCADGATGQAERGWARRVMGSWREGIRSGCVRRGVRGAYFDRRVE